MGFYLDWSAAAVIVILAFLFTIGWKTILFAVRFVKASWNGRIAG